MEVYKDNNLIPGFKGFINRLIRSGDSQLTSDVTNNYNTALNGVEIVRLQSLNWKLH